ncbi:MAG: hypothetical protein HYW86_01090 [Candidatus Roizmanbacteria bacterium]|nr:MAG: hypothetical protein HYW86_01090 [Candidatus Roizmanbacteria bacterium]
MEIKSKHGLLKSFMLNPDITFENQHEDEKVFLFLRAHLATQITWIISVVILFILLLIFDFLAASFIGFRQLLVINIFAIIFMLSFAWLNYLHWFFNVGIITDERIIDIDFNNILYREINSARLKSIEDITSKGVGFFGSLFNYGDIFIQTAGTETNIEFYHVPDPSKVTHIINGLLKP